MYFNRLLTAAAVAAMMAGAAQAQPTDAAQPAGASPPATAAEAPKVVAQGDIVTTARMSGQFTTFLKAVDATNLTNLLSQTKNITVFMPTDAAFAALPPGELDKLMSPDNRAALQKLLIYHIVNASLDSSKFKGAKGPVPTVAGVNVEIDGSGDHIMVNDADVVQTDVMATNGVIHVIDKVLNPDWTPPPAAAEPAAEAPAEPQH
ncbi:fasciclin domain-containing protein [Phenylobacterium sp.]|uniref:fasciclin domain-containing protein n=1 Tax=Phenylobacterium sp. TaxID=1871053 RepID=UPI0035B0AD82